MWPIFHLCFPAISFLVPNLGWRDLETKPVVSPFLPQCKIECITIWSAGKRASQYVFCDFNYLIGIDRHHRNCAPTFSDNDWDCPKSKNQDHIFQSTPELITKEECSKYAFIFYFCEQIYSFTICGLNIWVFYLTILIPYVNIYVSVIYCILKGNKSSLNRSNTQTTSL